MINPEEAKVSQTSSAPADSTTSSERGPGTRKEARPKEIGGRDGPEPTRFGDWEKNGRCIDF